MDAEAKAAFAKVEQELASLRNEVVSANNRLVDALNGDAAHPSAGLRDIAVTLDKILAAIK